MPTDLDTGLSTGGTTWNGQDDYGAIQRLIEAIAAVQASGGHATMGPQGQIIYYYDDPNPTPTTTTTNNGSVVTPPPVFVPPNPDLWDSPLRTQYLRDLLNNTGALARGVAMQAPPTYQVLTSDAKWQANPNSKGTWFDGKKWRSHPLEFNVLNPWQFIGSFGQIHDIGENINDDLSWIKVGGHWNAAIPSNGPVWWMGGGKSMQFFRIAAGEPACYRRIKIKLQSYEVTGAKKTMRIPNSYAAYIGMDPFLQIGYGELDYFYDPFSFNYADMLVNYSIDPIDGALVYNGPLRREWYANGSLSGTVGAPAACTIVPGNSGYHVFHGGGVEDYRSGDIVRADGPFTLPSYSGVGSDHAGYFFLYYMPDGSWTIQEATVSQCLANSYGNVFVAAAEFDTDIPSWALEYIQKVAPGTVVTKDPTTGIVTYRDAQGNVLAGKWPLGNYLCKNRYYAQTLDRFAVPDYLPVGNTNFARPDEVCYPIFDDSANDPGWWGPSVKGHTAPAVGLRLRLFNMDAWDYTIITEISFEDPYADPFA